MKKIGLLTNAALVFGLCANASGAFVINELDSDTPGGDSAEYIELKGNPGESADGLILVFYDGSDGSISFNPAVDLTGLTADENGYILIGSDEVPGIDLELEDAFIHNAQEAVALYQDLASNHPKGSTPTMDNLVDVVVHRAIGAQNNDWSGFGNPPVYDEAEIGPPARFSLSRIPDGTGVFTASELTPGSANRLKDAFSVDIPFFQRVNQSTALAPITKTITFRNTGGGSIQLTSLELATTSSAVFSVIESPTPGLPVTLAYDDTVTMVVQFLESDVSANKTYTGAINYATDDPTSPTGSVAFGTELVLATQTAAVGDVMVNEICYTGNFDHNNDGTLAGQGDEFVELVNMTNAPILIEGWEQRCTNNDTVDFHSFVFPAGSTLPANGFVTVFTGGNPTGFTPGTTFVYGIARIRNNGAYVGINDGSKLIDGVAYDLAEDNPDVDGYANAGELATAGDTIGRRPDGSDTFRAFATDDALITDRPSPNATNDDLATINNWSLF